MKILVLSTSTNETTKYSQDLAGLGHEIKLMAYDLVDHSEQLLYSRAKEFGPQMIVYIGSRWGKQPSTATLARITQSIAPMVHLCSDAGDGPWWDLLMEYHYKGAFSLQVTIDGARKWPLYDVGMTALTPVDPALFPAEMVPHESRAIGCGYAGNSGGGPASQRTILLGEMLGRRAIDLRIRSNLPFTYESYCDYLAKCRMSLNIAFTGTEMAKHVKGRVLESGLAGCCLLETAGSPTSDWFTPGLDYIEYSSAEECAGIIARLTPVETEGFGRRLRAKVLAEHTPEKFWGRVFERLQLPLLAA